MSTSFSCIFFRSSSDQIASQFADNSKSTAYEPESLLVPLEAPASE
jgi:hypothetical protein